MSLFVAVIAAASAGRKTIGVENRSQAARLPRARPPSAITLGTAIPRDNLVTATANFDMLLGVEPDSPVRWVIPGGYLAVALLGVVWALILKATRPNVYQRIGLGAKAASVGALGLSLPGRRPAEATAIRQEPIR